MNHNYKIIYKILFSIVLTYFLAIYLLSPLLHNHKQDFRFHDNCPACYWEIQIKNDIPEIMPIMGSTCVQPITIEYISLEEIILTPQKVLSSRPNPRAPPA